MEQSAFEALMIGVNVFVFIIALTAAVLLMSNVIDMVNFANEQAIVGMNGTLAETVGVVTERTYTGVQMLSYYNETIKDEEFKYNFKVKLSKNGQEKSIQDFIKTEVITNYLNKEFTLEYKGVKNKKDTYVFSLKNENNSET